MRWVTYSLLATSLEWAYVSTMAQRLEADLPQQLDMEEAGRHTFVILRESGLIRIRILYCFLLYRDGRILMNEYD